MSNNCISHLSITKDGPQSNQLTKILEAIPYLCQDKHYDYISDIISTNTELTQEYFLSDHSIKKQRPSKHHAKVGVVDHFIGLNVPSSNSPINSDMVENTPISNPYPQVQHDLDHNQGSLTRSHEWKKLITNKKSILDQCDKATRAESTLGQSPEDDVMIDGLLKFITKMRKVCTNCEDKDVLFGSSITRITELYIRPATKVEQLLAAHPDNDSIWNNTDPCDVSLDNKGGTKGSVSIDVTKEPVKATTTPMSIKIDNNTNVAQDSVTIITTPMSIEDDKTWYDANEEYDLWHNAAETMVNYQEWVDSPTVLGDTDKPSLLTNILDRIFMTANTIQDF